MVSPNKHAREPWPLWLALPRLTSAFLNSAFVIITLPILVLYYSPPEQKGLQLGLLVGISVALTVAVLLGVGYASDSLPGLRVRRKPFIIFGHTLVLPAALLSIVSPPYAVMVVAVYLLVAARSAIDAAHLPLLNDLVAVERRGKYSAPVSMMLVIGAASGAVLAGYLAQEADKAGTPTAFLGPLAIVSLVLAVVVTIIFTNRVREPAREARPTRLLQLLRNLTGERERGYYRFMIARTVYLIGIFSVLIFFVYLVKEVYQAPDFKLAAGIYYAIAALSATAFALPAGLLSDRFGCLRVVIGCGFVQALSCILIFFLASVHLAFAYSGALMFGGAFGGMYAAALALSTKLIPSAGDTAKYMALLVVSTYAAQLIASLTAGPLLDLFNSLRDGSGYIALFILAETCFAGGGAIFWRIREPSTAPSADADRVI